MPVNFLEFSESYRERNKVRNDYCKIGEIVCAYLKNDYSLPKEISPALLTVKVQKEGIGVGSESVRRFIKTLQVARNFLMADEKGKVRVFGELDGAIGKGHKRIINMLIEDGITEWSQIEAMIEVSSSEEIPESELAKIELEEVSDEEAASEKTIEEQSSVLEKMDFYFVADKLRGFISILPSEINKALSELEKKYKAEKSELCECLDELMKCRTNLEGVELLKAILTQERERGNKLAEENASLVKENLELKLKLEEERLSFKNMGLAEMFRVVAEKMDSEKGEKKSASAMVKRKAVEPVLAKPAVIVLPAKSKDENLSLPEIYVPTGVKVKFRKYFERAMDELWQSNKKVAKTIHKALTDICAKGKDGVSLHIKTINEESKNTPANSLQVSVRKKYRFTFRIFANEVIFYAKIHHFA